MIGAIILAAGESRRMGRAKQLLDWQGEPMIRFVVRNVLQAKFDLVRVVSGAYADEVAHALEGLPVEILVNLQYSKGQSTSVRRGLHGLPDEVRGMAFVLADQPLVRSVTLDHLVRYFLEEEPGILIPTYGGQRGNPVFFHQEFFCKLLQLEGDRGGRELIREHPEWVKLLEVDDPGIRIDLDEERDYQHYVKQVTDDAKTE